jgi:hypothetical protein
MSKEEAVSIESLMYRSALQIVNGSPIIYKSAGFWDIEHLAITVLDKFFEIHNKYNALEDKDYSLIVSGLKLLQGQYMNEGVSEPRLQRLLDRVNKYNTKP